MAREQDYQVTYTIDVYAASPEEAAREVAQILDEGGALRGVYSVVDEDGDETEIDLHEIDGMDYF